MSCSLPSCPLLAGHVLQFFDLRFRCSTASVCRRFKDAVRFAVTEAGRDSPQVLSVLFCHSVGWLELDCLLRQFSFVTSLEISQRQMPCSIDDCPSSSCDASASDAEEAFIARDCEKQRVPFGEFFTKYLLDYKCMMYCQNLIVHCVHRIDTESLGFGLRQLGTRCTLWHSDFPVSANATATPMMTLPRDIVPAQLPLWRQERGMHCLQSSIRALYYCGHREGLCVEDCALMLPRCPALEICFFPYLAPIHRFGNACLRLLGEHCQQLRVLHLRNPKRSRITAEGLAALHIESLETLVIGGVQCRQDVHMDELRERLEAAPLLQTLHHSFRGGGDPQMFAGLRTRGATVVFECMGDNPAISGS
eukprot:TRINITY_DN20673_c0_g2_i1.p1 TRINITY_DN20673_c0_g2~~TRINITY_DN20673_c0_g2_i1.p1  ORF type:complete len:363 (-),score=30.77 TRINITY_DN20673_c0_g2_i1:87-1175(-)